MSEMKELAYDLAEKYLEDHPDATWDEAMKAIMEIREKIQPFNRLNKKEE